jgi:mono/diheme cytochrome c family protein
MRLSQYRVAVTSASLLLVAAFAGCGQPPASAPAEPAATPVSGAAQVERGRLLIMGGACHDCHTPKKIGPNGPEADMSRTLSGHPESDVITAPFKQAPGDKWTTHVNDHLTAWSGAWGVSFAANLTPDENTGVGIWTDDMFVSALQKGKHMGAGRQILPPMPWNWYGQLPPEDLKAILAYLKSIPAISNRVPVPLGPDGKPIEAPEGGGAD